MLQTELRLLGALHAETRLRGTLRVAASLSNDIDHAFFRMRGAEFRLLATLCTKCGMLSAPWVAAPLGDDVDHVLFRMRQAKLRKLAALYAETWGCGAGMLRALCWPLASDGLRRRGANAQKRTTSRKTTTSRIGRIFRSP